MALANTANTKPPPKQGWEQSYDAWKTKQANAFGRRVQRNDPSLRAPNDLLGRFLKDLPGLAAGSVLFPFQAQRAINKDELGLVRGQMPTHSAKLLLGQARGIGQTVQHPLRHPGNTLALGAMALPFVRGAGARLDAGVKSYGGPKALVRRVASEQTGELSSGRLNPGARDTLRRIANSKPDEHEQMVRDSKLGIAHHGTPFPFAADEIQPYARTGDDAVPRTYLTPDKLKAARFASTKAHALGQLDVADLANKLYELTPWGNAKGGHHLASRLDRATVEGGLPFSGTKAREVQLQNGESFLQPRVHSYFVDARNPIHLGDVPNPGALELLKEKLQSENMHAASSYSKSTERQQFNLNDWPQHFEGARSYQELFKRLQERLPKEWAPWIRQDVMSEALTKHVGADAVVSKRGTIMVPSTLNLWHPSVVERAQQIAHVRAAAADVLAHDAKGEKPTLTAKQARDFAEALRAGKVGPLRERITLKNLLDTPGVEKPYYRGVATAYKRENAKQWAEHSLHGPGSYHTDSRQVADSYVGATNPGEGAGNIRLATPISGKRGLFNLDKMAQPETMERLAKAVHDYHERLSHKSPMPLDARSGAAAERAFRGAFSNEDGTWGNDNGDYVRDWLGDRYGQDHARRIMVKAGIRVLEHEGGRIIGGHGHHNVRIGLKPSVTQPFFQTQRLLGSYAQALKALEHASGMRSASAAEKAQYLHSYAKTLHDELDKRTGERPLLDVREPGPRVQLARLRAVRRYGEIQRNFGGEGVVLLAKAYHAGLFSKPTEIQAVANEIIKTMHYPGMNSRAVLQPSVIAQNLDVLRKVLAERQHGKLQKLYQGGFPY